MTNLLKKIESAFFRLLNLSTTAISEFKDETKTKYFSQLNWTEFDDIWKFKTDWFEPPNERRGGWSGVNKVVFKPNSPESEAFGVYLKRQQNHVRKTLRHPFNGISTFVREFEMLKYLSEQNVNAPIPLFFANRIIDGNQQAILITQELAGYSSLEEVVDKLFAGGMLSHSSQTSLLQSVAIAVKRLHKAKVQHRSLYPKHIFVREKTSNEYDIAFIDLEKSRITSSDFQRTYKDLATLNRHSGTKWSRTKRLYFFLQYLQINRLDSEAKALIRRIYTKSMRDR